MVAQTLSAKKKRRVRIYHISLIDTSRRASLTHFFFYFIEAMDVDKETFIPGRTKLAPGETLSPDPSTYDMLHTLSTPWPCLSFDIVRDSLGDNRKTYPATVYAVTGTQAEGSKSKENELMILKMSGLSKMEKGGEESDSDSDDDDMGEPILEHKSIPLGSTTNRIRTHQTPSQSGDYSKPPQTLTATWLENSQVVIHDVTAHLASFDVPGTILPPSASKPLSTLRMHKTEGYALDWSPLQPLGKLLTGDNDGLIYATTRTEGGGWVTDTRPFTGHTSSIEELQWSPNERNVFASASSDGSVKVWDVRSKSRKPAVDVQVSNTDVNVMSWSNQTAHLLATGADDGQWAVWDLRHWKPNAAAPSAQITSTPVASFDFHKEPITSIEWHPSDDSVVAVGSADNTVTLWDLAVELDDEESRAANMADIPSQLLFVHYMESVKELHWQAQMPGTLMATGSSGFRYVVSRWRPGNAANHPRIIVFSRLSVFKRRFVFTLRPTRELHVPCLAYIPFEFCGLFCSISLRSELEPCLEMARMVNRNIVFRYGIVYRVSFSHRKTQHRDMALEHAVFSTVEGLVEYSIHRVGRLNSGSSSTPRQFRAPSQPRPVKR
jgi:ribosome assembly protein RRB1